MSFFFFDRWFFLLFLIPQSKSAKKKTHLSKKNSSLFRQVFFGLIWHEKALSSAQGSHQKSHQSYLRTLCSLYNVMNEVFFFCQKSLWQHHLILFFFKSFFFTVWFPGAGRYLNENKLR